MEDNGPGFPEEELPYVFRKFYRLKDTNKSGTGLGLSIVKGFTEALEGTIEFSRSKDVGAKFTLTLPVKTSTLHSIDV